MKSVGRPGAATANALVAGVFRISLWGTPNREGFEGLDGIRVVDASVMPYVTNGNIYAPVMVAERASDVVLGVTPLPPERQDG